MYLEGEIVSKGKKGLLITVSKTLAHPLRPTQKAFINKDTVANYEVQSFSTKSVSRSTKAM